EPISAVRCPLACPSTPPTDKNSLNSFLALRAMYAALSLPLAQGNCSVLDRNIAGADQLHRALQMLAVHALDRLDRGRGIRRNRHQRKLVDLGLGELQAASLQGLIAKRAEADRHAPDQSGLHRLPSHVH